MKKLTLLTLSALAMLATACQNTPKHHYELVALDGWHTCIEGEDFNTDGLKVYLKCTDEGCEEVKEVEYELENNTNLALDQTSIKIKSGEYELDYPITVKPAGYKYRIACVGDSLTAGHNWPNESYPTYLGKAVTDKYEVDNYGVNGISITGYGGSWDAANKRYIKQDVYKNACKFAPDIFAIMLGTNDATNWAKAEATFVDEYHILLDAFKEQFPNAKFIMMVSPPVVYPNQFGIPNEEIKNYVNPVQRQLAEEYGFEMLDLRKEFEETENYQTKYLRPNNDNVHFTKAAAQYVAGRVWDIAKDLRF